MSFPESLRGEIPTPSPSCFDEAPERLLGGGWICHRSAFLRSYSKGGADFSGLVVLSSVHRFSTPLFSLKMDMMRIFR